MLAEDGQETSGLVHTLEAYRTCRKFDKGRRRWGMRFGGQSVRGLGERVLGVVRECSRIGSVGVGSQKLDRLDEDDMAVFRL
jgi:hypothetical protein